MDTRKSSFRLLSVLVCAVAILLVLAACAVIPTPYPTYTLSPTQTPYPTHTPYSTPTPMQTPELAPTATRLPTLTPTPLPTPIPTLTPTPTPEPGATPTPTPTPVTLEGYIAFVCAEGKGPDYLYWGDFVERLAPHIEARRSIRPPDDLLAYHEALIALFEAMVEVARHQDPNAYLDFFVLEANPRYMAARDAHDKADEALPGKISIALRGGECP